MNASTTYRIQGIPQGAETPFYVASFRLWRDAARYMRAEFGCLVGVNRSAWVSDGACAVLVTVTKGS